MSNVKAFNLYMDGELEGKKIVFQHIKGSAAGKHFKNDEKVAVVTDVFQDDIENDREYPIRVELTSDGAPTRIDFNEIKKVIDDDT